jgi:diguanylate cyclase (GGDEF)-like protein/PAS domain S-box-containing protein
LVHQRPTIGVLIPLVGGFYYASLLAGVQRVAQRRGARVVAFQTTSMDLLWPNESGTGPLGWNRIDGWIGINDGEGTAYYERLLDHGKPLVTVSARLQRGVAAVLPDNRGGMLNAVRHLLEHGHTRIAFAGSLNQTDIRERYDGYQAALNERGLMLDPELFLPTSGNLELDGRETGKKLVAAGLPCSALVAGTDLNAIGILQVVRESGYRVPEDLAIVGFDDVDLAQYTDPPLATVRHRFDASAAKATEILLDHLLVGAPLPAEVRVPTVVVQRQSCGCRSADSASSSFGATADSARVQQLKVALERAANDCELGGSATVWSGAERLALHVAAVAGGADGVPLEDIRQAWRELLAMTQDLATIEALFSIVDRTLTAWVADGGGDPAAIQTPLREVRLELMRAWRMAEQSRRRYYDSVIEANRKINLALIGADLDSAQSLSWLRWTHLRYGELGMWEQRSDGRVLRIVSRFELDGARADAVAPRRVPTEYPGLDVLDRADRLGDANIVSVVPITGSHGNRGLLTVVGPVENELFDEMGALSQWAALLSAAMDRERLLTSLKEGYERERLFGATLRESEERYALAARGANDGLWDWNVGSGRVYFSPRWKAMLGYADDEIETDISAWFALVHPEDSSTLRQVISEHLDGGNSHIEHEYRMAHKRGGYRWMLCRGVAVFDASGKAVRVAGSQTDITARKEVEEQLKKNALHDALTGLPNRALLIDRLEQAITRAARGSQARFAVLFLDLDHFKTINDSLGHIAGDQLLVEISQRLSHCLRSSDTVARLGGDEFAIILSDVGSEPEATFVAERIQQTLRAPFYLDGHEVFTSSSIGITFSSNEYQRAEHFLRDADTAMYRAKIQGRGCHEIFHVGMHDQAVERLRIEAGLRRAIEQGELALYYQPILSLRTGAIDGVEALIRWRHPEHGFLSPVAFLPVAEESGLIVPLSEWVLRTACREVAHFRAELPRPLRVSINVPSQQLKDRRLVTLVTDTLAAHQLPPSALALELVESSLIENREATIAVLQRLQGLGVQIAVDDFGTGYSSLSYLKRLPIDSLKIDRSFTQGIPSDPNDVAICTTIIAMARNLKLNVVAEGVETQEQMDYLRGQGCDQLQGFLFAKPLPAAECLAFIKAHHAAGATRTVIRIA